MRSRALILLSLCVAAGWLLSWDHADAQVLPAERAFSEAWRNAGHPGGGLPQNRTLDVREFGALGDGSANDRPAILAAFTALGGSPGVVYFPPGTYLIQSAINVPGGVVLRGHSPEQTLLRFDFVENAIRFSGTQTGNWIAITESAAIHASAFVVADAQTFSPGDYALLTQDDDPAWNITDDWGMGSAGQVVKITAITGNQIQIERPLRHDYPLERNPLLRRMVPIRNSGIENLRLERLLAGNNTSRNNIHTVQFNNAADCWMRGVQSRMAFGSHVAIDYSTRVEITGCYFDDAHEFDGGGSGYGLRFQFRSGECLIQDNIFRRLRHSILLQAGPNGNVVAYNYSREGNSDSHPGYASDLCLHGNYPYGNLFEGNIVGHIWLDNSHDGANGPLNTFFRNRAEIAGYNMTDARAHRQNVIGNELYRGGFLAQLAAGNGYRFQGTGHFTYANNSTASGLQPAGTGNLTDISYYLNDNPSVPPVMPSWWNIADTLPVIGPPNTFSATKNIPARARWFAGGALTVPAEVPVASTSISGIELTSGSAATAVFKIVNSGPGILNWKLGPVAYGPGSSVWVLAVSPSSGSLATGEIEVTVTLDRALLGVEPSNAVLEIQSNGGNVHLPIAASAPRYLITTQTDGGGSISPENPELLHGQSHNFQIVPQAWHDLVDVLVDGQSIGPVSNYLWPAANAPGVLQAVFAQQVVATTPVPVPRPWLAENGITTDMEAAVWLDLDGDGQPVWREFLADTNPQNPASVFRAEGPVAAAESVVVGFGPSSPNRIYTLQQATQLTPAGWQDVPGQGPRVGTGAADQMTAPPAAEPATFYRIKVSLPQ